MILVWDYRKNVIRFEDHDTISLFNRNTDLMGIKSALEVHELYAATTNSDIHLKTGWLGEGGLLAEKAQDEALVFYTGALNLLIYVDKVLAHTEVLNTAAFDVHKFKLPLAVTRNNFIEVEVLGTGELFELYIPQESANR